MVGRFRAQNHPGGAVLGDTVRERVNEEGRVERGRREGDRRED